jgi:hypothetical protein
MGLGVAESAAIRESFEIRVRRGGKLGRPALEQRQGDDHFAAEGRWVQKMRRIDREGDQYDEVITDPETGRILHEKHERLSDHRGHGSARGNGNTR